MPNYKDKLPGMLAAKGLCLLLLPALCGCVQDDYDLADVDTTARLTVNNLALPVKIDNVKLSSIIDIKEGGDIQVVAGRYAVRKQGTFSSAEIRIEPVHFDAPPGSSSTKVLHLATPRQGVATARRTDPVFYPLESEPLDYAYSADNVSESIISISSVGTQGFRMVLTLQATGLPSTGITFRDVVFGLPMGLATDYDGYDPATGLLTIPSFPAGGTGVEIGISAVDFPAFGGTLANRRATIAGSIRLIGGRLEVDPGALNDFTPPSTVTLTTSCSMGAIDLTEFSGEVQYGIDDVRVSPVSLSSLPGFLKQPGTDLRLADPEILLTVSNPLAANGLEARSGLTITSVSKDGLRTPYTLDPPGYFTVKAQPQSVIALSPRDPTFEGEGGQQPEDGRWVPFSSLGAVLSGDGIPSTLEITLDSPQVFPQEVTRLPLGRQLGSVRGDYTFFAPLSLEPGAKIRYQDDLDGWNDPDVDAIVIESLTVTASVTNNLPIAVNFTGYPIDVNHRDIDGVQIVPTPSTIAAGETTDVTITITGVVRHLDGISFTADATAQSDQPLAPGMTVDLADIKARVSGYYEKEL